MVREYQRPTVELLTVDIEQGFAASYGDAGSAGGDFEDGGDFDI